MPALLLMVACASPHGHGEREPSFSIALSQGELEPPFDPDILHYAVKEADLDDPVTTITASDDAILEHRTLDGTVLTAAAGSLDVPLTTGQCVLVAAGDVTYQVTVVPTSLGVIDAEGVASEGAILLATTTTLSTPSSLLPYLLIVDERGVPLWYRQTSAPAIDFHATADGHLVYLDPAKAGKAGWEGIILGANYATERVVTSESTVDGLFVATDFHFIDLVGDDAIVSGRSRRFADMREWGAPKGCCQIVDYVVQQVAPDDSVVFEWNTKDHLDFSGLAEAQLEKLYDGWEYAHLNSWDLDPSDETWLLSNLWTSQVMRVAPRAMTWRGAEHAAGDILERIGGSALSDYTFPDDDRGIGWEGFVAQHSARALPDNHLLLYDNGYRLDLDENADSRAAEYALDPDAGTATLVWSHAADGAGATPYGGSVQRLPNGGTLIGWGGLPGEDKWAPSATEVDADGEVVFTLTLAGGKLVSYRAAKAVLVDGHWTTP